MIAHLIIEARTVTAATPAIATRVVRFRTANPSLPLQIAIGSDVKAD